MAAAALFKKSHFEELEQTLPYFKDYESAHLALGYNTFQKFFCQVDDQAHLQFVLKKEHYETACSAMCGLRFKEPRRPPGAEGRRITRNGGNKKEVRKSKNKYKQ